jgi:hypothetical protein
MTGNPTGGPCGRCGDSASKAAISCSSCPADSYDSIAAPFRTPGMVPVGMIALLPDSSRLDISAARSRCSAGSGSPAWGQRHACRSPRPLSVSMTGPRSAPAGVRRCQTSRRPGSQLAVTISGSSSSRRRWLSVLGVISPAFHQVGEPLGAGEMVPDQYPSTGWRMSCTTRLAIYGRSSSPGSPRSRLRPASCCTAVRDAPAWAASTPRCLPGAPLASSAAGWPPAR